MIVKEIIKYFKIIIFIPIFFLEVFLYKIFRKKNSENSYQLMIFFFSKFGNLLNKFLAKFLSKKKIKNFLFLNSNIFLKKSKKIISRQLDNNGYFLIKNALSDSQIFEIKKYLKKLKGFYVSDKKKNQSKKEYLNPKHPKGVKFFYSSNDLIKLKLIQDLAFDRNILSIAQKYLGSAPILDIVTAWWSFSSAEPDKTAAQFWHFDMDRPTWLKVFFYLTDCKIQNGPHCFVSGTHYKNGISYKLRSQGYSRLTDLEVKRIYNDKSIKKFTTSKGSLLLEDSSGLHKGLHLKKGKRLILQFQYSSSLFGAKDYKLNFPTTMSKNFLLVKKNYQEILENFK